MSLSDFSIDTMSLLDDESFSEVSEEVPAWTKQKWRESLDKYKKPRNLEIEEWVSNTTTKLQFMKKEIKETIEDIYKERRQDTKIFLNSFLEKERFSQQFPKFSPHSEKKSPLPRKRKFDEMEM